MIICFFWIRLNQLPNKTEDLVQLMLKGFPADRISAQDSLQHPYFSMLPAPIMHLRDSKDSSSCMLTAGAPARPPGFMYYQKNQVFMKLFSLFLCNKFCGTKSFILSSLLFSCVHFQGAWNSSRDRGQRHLQPWMEDETSPAAHHQVLVNK